MLVVDKTDPLEPDQERTVLVTFLSRPGRRIEDLFEPAVITAGILADGTTTRMPCYSHG